MDKFLIIDKSAGITSFDVIRKTRKILGVRKIGHAGTLDPMATGVLVLGIGSFTKKLNEMIKKDKVYEAEILIGARSDTYDKDGQVEYLDKKLLKNITEETINKALERFTGKIKQMPPKYSAKKIKGKRACDLMRQGKEVKLEPKEVEVYEMEIISIKRCVGTHCNVSLRGFISLNLKIHCGSGFYVRSLAHDLGEMLGCGGVLWNLRRTKVGEFGIEEAVKLEEIGGIGV